MAKHDLGRLTEDVKREISAALPEIKDKHVSGEIVSVSRVEITSDLSYCKIYISCLGGEEKTAEAVKALERSAGFFVRRINARIRMRKMPRLIFVPDNSQEYYEKISRILDSLPELADEKDDDKTDGE
ncbi:MAG: 30S ribosome-binding factor RbfA [Ruminiclostridium sp.]|nr:30S ribosome-binding factor RbfA [Ruminiclostridium sp.]